MNPLHRVCIIPHGPDPDDRRRSLPRLQGVVAGLSLAALLLSVPGQASGQAQPSSLKILGTSRMTLDPVCNARSGASIDSMLRNDGSEGARLALSAAEPISKTAGKVAVAKVTVTPLDAAGRPAPDTKWLPQKELMRVRVDLTGTLDSGEWEIEVRNAGTPVGTITVVNPPVGSGVKLDVATPDNPELVFQRKKATTIPLKNEDGIDYQVSGQYSVRGVVRDTGRPILLSAHGGAELTLTPSRQWFAGGVREFFKDDVADGRLTVRFASAACRGDAATPVRVFKVKTTLAAWPAAVKDAKGTFVLLLTLFLGGICSLLLNFFLPAHGRRLKASAQLSLLARRIDDIPEQTDPRVRISVAVERRQLTERLGRLKLSTQFSPEMTEIEQGLIRLRTRLDLLAQMQLVLNRYWRQRSVIVSDDIEELRRQLIDLLRRSDPGDSDIQAAQSLIKKIDERLTNASANAINPELAGRLAKQVGELQKDFDPTGPLGTSLVSDTLRAALPEEFERVMAAPTDPLKIAPADYVRLGRAVFILTQARTFIRLCTNKSEFAGAITALIPNLRGGTWDQLNRAERLIRQIGEEIFWERVESEIKGKRVVIESIPTLVRQFEPTELRVVFLDKGVHSSAAREDYTCKWVFEHANREATGWSVSHFFPLPTDPEIPSSEPEVGRLRKAWRSLTVWFKTPEVSKLYSKPYRVTVMFVRAGGSPVEFIRADGSTDVGEVTKEFHVRPPSSVKVRGSFWSEGLRLALALSIAAAGLIVGAREQVLKLDVFPALIAVFLLGFGSDRIKNLFTQRSPSASEETKPAGAG